jgi:epoxyqueuosine reductase QueG
VNSEIIESIKSTVSEYDRFNSLNFWKEPIIEIISAANKEIKLLKEIVSPEHLLPADILPGAKSIISFFIPFQEKIVNSNIEGQFASKEWALCYIETNDLIKTINNNIEILMNKNGYKTGKIPATHNFDKEKLISNWSHRHIAYIAGLGTFGINNMLITKNGCCGRFGSIIIDYKLSDYKNIEKPKEKCLYKLNRSCGKCQKKCPVNAYENGNFNRQKCYELCLKNGEKYKNFGIADVCGKCTVGLPCSV